RNQCAPRLLIAGSAIGTQKGTARHPKRCPGLRTVLQSESFTCVSMARSVESFTRNQANFGRQPVRCRKNQSPLRVISSATPVRAADVPWKYQSSAQAWRREDSFVAKLPQPFLAPARAGYELLLCK